MTSIRVEWAMQVRRLRAALAGVSAVALCVVLAPAARADDAPALRPTLSDADVSTAIPLPDDPVAVLAVNELAPSPSIAMPALPEVADRLIVEMVAGPAVDVVVPLPDALPPPVITAEMPPSPAQAPAHDDVAVTVPLPEVAEILIVDREKALQPVARTEQAFTVPLPDELPSRLAVEALGAPVVLALRDLVGSGPLALPAGLTVGRRDREALVAFYAAREFQPLWLQDGAWTPAARAIAGVLETADRDGLDPGSYPVLHPGKAAGPAALAQAEFALSAAAFAYARDARGGRIEPTRLSSLITPDLDLPRPDEVLGALQASAAPDQVLAGFQPRHAGYAALRAKLAELRDSTAALAPRLAVADGPTLVQGMQDERVPALRDRLGLPARADDVYDEDLAGAVRAFQRARGLPASGRLDRRTVAALDDTRGGGSFTAADIVANMERWRWLPQDLGERHIIVNLPEFTLRLVEEGQVIHRTRVIIGKTETPTPVFSHAMDHVIVNPYWNIPPSILRKEILPKLKEDPDYAAKRGYEVIRRGNSISVRQPPGERNALGFIKFMFPNQHAVYLHDTPTRNLFANERRAYSHGCVRVEQPFRLAEFVLGDQGYTEERMRAMIGKGERTIRLKTPLPVHLTYFTLTVDETGRLRRVDDLYGYDGKVKTALGVGADGRRFAQLKRAEP
ncbi:L,D-transpeptidase family protein [Alsobacter sp. R-9]